MLEPQGRHSIYDIVRAPAGFELDCLVATTYSASLDTVLSLPAALLADIPGMAQRTPGIFTAAELAALKRICGRTLIFCQGGAIHPAEHLPPAIIEAEDMIHEVLAPNGGNFHPKVWVIRFRHHEAGRSLLRVAVMSRNLTADRSWDAGVVLENRPTTTASNSNDLSRLLRLLPTICIRPLDPDRHKILLDLAREVEAVRWKMPEGAGTPTFHLLGNAAGRGWVQPEYDRLAIISPFLSATAIKGLAGTARCPLVLSRPDALERCWPVIRSRFDRHMVLAPPGELIDAPRPAGLHAKMILWERRSRTRIAIGSMNATAAATDGRNVEFMVSFDCTSAIGGAGIDALLDRRGLGAVLEDFEPEPLSEPKPEPFDDRPARAILVSAQLHLQCAVAENGWELSLVPKTGIPAIEKLLPKLRFRPATLGGNRAASCGAFLATGQPARFPGTLDLSEITGFTVFEADGPDGPFAFILNLEVCGVNDDARRHAALKVLLPDERTFSHFLMILLGDFHTLQVIAAGTDTGSQMTAWSPAGRVGLLEMLIRCAVDEPARLRSIEETLNALGVEQLEALTPPEFRSLWSAMLQIAGLRP